MMKLILEYNVYNVLKDNDNYEFLKKVKNQNPDLYSKFMNIIIKKGLEYAKKEYLEHDPDLIKYRNKIKKNNKTKEERLKDKKEYEEKVLSTNSETINNINNILKNNIQMDNIKKIINNENISRIIKNLNLKRKYTTDFLKTLKSPKNIHFKKFTAVCTLSYKGEDRYADYHFNNYSYIKISQYYSYSGSDSDSDSDSLYYKLNLGIYAEDTIKDIIKENNYELNDIDDYIKFVNFSIYKLSSSLVQPYDNIIEKLERLSYILSIKSYEDWMLENNVNKYNI